MRNVILSILAILVISSCDPVASMEANIENQTSRVLSLEFVSKDTLEVESKTFIIGANQSVLFQEVFDVGNTYLEPYLIEYDSVILREGLTTVLKVFKENSSGKNIYNIGSSWISREDPKRFFYYTYQLNEEDLQ